MDNNDDNGCIWVIRYPVLRLKIQKSDLSSQTAPGIKQLNQRVAIPMLVSPLSALWHFWATQPPLPLSACGGVTYASWKWNAYGDGNHFCFSHPLVLHLLKMQKHGTIILILSVYFSQSKQGFYQLKFVWPGRDFFFWVSPEYILSIYNSWVSDKKFKRRAWGRVCRKLFEWPCLVIEVLFSVATKRYLTKAIFRISSASRVIHCQPAVPQLQSGHFLSVFS